MSNYDLWVILGNWKPEFSSYDFGSAFPSPDPRKILYDMTKKGFLERIERGKYKVISPENYAKTLSISTTAMHFSEMPDLNMH